MSRNPFQPDQRVEIHIDKLAARGYGLGRVQNIVFFVPFTVPGDRILARVTRRQRSYNFAVCEEILVPSPLRVEPGCPHFATCGGCAFLNMDYDQQLSWKRAVLMEQLRNLPMEIREAIPSPSHHYRNKMMMKIQRQNGRLIAGFNPRRSHDLIAIDHCRLQTGPVNRLKNAFLGRVEESLQPADQDCLRGLFIRINQAGCMQLVVVAVREINLRDVVDRLIEDEPFLSSVGVFLNDDPGNCGFQRGPENSHAGNPLRWLHGKAELTEEVAGEIFMLPPESFFQVNLYQLETMVELAREMAGRGGLLVDLYAGAGFFGRTLGGGFEQVHLVEISPASAESFATVNPDPQKYHFHCGDAGVIAAELVAAGLKADCLVIDPPRAGLTDEALTAVLALEPGCLVMISCNPATLARDLERLQNQNYFVETLVPIDNFPQTEHLEVVCRLTRGPSRVRMEESE